MKNRILSLLLVLILLVTVSVFAVEAALDEGEAAITFAEAVAANEGTEAKTMTFYCEACDDNVEWTRAMVNSSSGKFYCETDHVYVPTTNLTTTANSVVKRVQHVYLAGNVTHDATATNVMFQLYYDGGTTKNDCELNIMGTGKLINNCTGQQLIKSNTNKSNTDGGKNRFVMWSGEIDCSGITSTVKGSVFFVDSTYSPYTEVVIKGGTIRGAKTGQQGGAFYMLDGSSFTMDGGTIYGHKDCTSLSGAAVYMKGTSSSMCTFNMSGGEIRDGAITSSSSSNATGGNIYLERCNATINGNAKILNGSVTHKTSGKQARGGNLYTNMCKVTISGNAEISGGSAISEKGTARAGNVYYNAGTAASHGLTISENALISGGYTNAASGSDSQGGNLYIYGNAEISGGTIQGGYTLVGTSKTNEKCKGGNIYTAGDSGSTVTMSGGTIQKTGVSGRQSRIGGNIYLSKPFTMSGGTIDGGNAMFGANVFVPSGVTMAVSGGTISDGYAIQGGNIYNAGEVTLSGGVISGGTAADGNTTNPQFGQNVLVANNDTNGAGKLKIANGYEGKDSEGEVFNLRVYFEGDVLAGNVISADRAAATNGYTNGAKVLATVNDEEYPVVGNSAGNLVLAGAVTYDLNSSGNMILVKMYETAQDAVDANDDGQFVQLRLPNQTFAPTAKTIVDFNGRDATVTDATYLIGMDSKTDSYVDNGAAKVTIEDGYHLENVAKLHKGSEANSGERKYLALENSGEDAGTYSFHRYYLTIDGAGLRYNDEGPGLLYSAAFKGDAAIAEAINNGGQGYGYGIEYFYNGVSLEDVNFIEEGVPFATNGQLQTGKKVAFSGFMTEEAADVIPGTDTYYANIKILGKAYIKIAGEKVYCSVGDENSLQDVIKVYYKSTDPVIVDMKQKYGTVFSNILQWDFAV